MTQRGCSGILLLCLFVCIPALEAAELRGKVVSIADGDTCTILDAEKQQHKIRLDGIDAPEKGQAFGTKSREALGRKVHEREVIITWTKRDRYQRILGRVDCGACWINREMVSEGWAWRYVQYSKDPELIKAETEARESKRGLWADKSPVPPWEWRKSEKERRKEKVKLWKGQLILLEKACSTDSGLESFAVTFDGVKIFPRMTPSKATVSPPSTWSAFGIKTLMRS